MMAAIITEPIIIVLSEAMRIPLIVFLITAALLSIGVTFGVPQWVVNDEFPVIGGALRMLELHNPIPSLAPEAMQILYYPPGLPWLLIIVWVPVLAVQWVVAHFPSPSDFALTVLASPEWIWLTARLTSVLAASGTALIVARLAQEASGSKRVALVAGLLMATSFHHAVLGHFARVWPMTVFLWWLGLFFSWRIFRDGRPRDYYFAALAAGLGFAVNYVGVLVSLSLGFAHLMRHRRLVIDRAIIQAVLITALLMAVILAASWPIFIRLLGFSPLGGEIAAAGKHIRITDLFGFYAATLAKSDIVLVIIGLIGLPLALRRAPVAVSLFLASLLPYAIIIFTGYVYDDRYIVPITPLLAFAGGFIMEWKKAGVFAAVVAIAIQTATVAQFDRLLLGKDTRVVACDWLDVNVPTNEGVISATRVVPEQTVSSIELERSLSPASVNLIRQLRLTGRITKTGGCGRPREAVRSDAISRMTPEEFAKRLQESGYRWLVVDRLPPDATPAEDALLRGAKLVATISPGDRNSPILSMSDEFAMGSEFDVFFMQRLGPTVYIYHL